MQDALSKFHEITVMTVWIDYRKLRGRITSIKCGPRTVIRRTGESIEALEGRAMWRRETQSKGHQ